VSDSLDRLFSRLVGALAREAPERAAGPVTISEIYQRLVPYRSIRSELEFSELPQYEHALLRLLAGERGYAVIDTPSVQEELARELKAPNPILGVYRDYAAVEVRLRPAAAPAGDDAPAAATGQGGEPLPELDLGLPRPTFVRSSGAAPGDLPPPTSAAPRDPPPPRERSARVPPAPADCPRCEHALPKGRDVWFCPFCGATQRQMPCGACGALLEPEWAYCIRCGTERQPGEAASAE
jgi:hypothetical protein